MIVSVPYSTGMHVRILADIFSMFTELQRRVTALTTELEVAREEKASVAAKRLDLERTVRVSGACQLPSSVELFLFELAL